MRKDSVITLIAFLALFLLGMGWFMRGENIEESNYLPLNEHWYVEINDTSYEDVTLDDFLFPVVNKGDILKMSCALPDQDSIANPVLRFYTIHSDIEIWCDDENIYSYGQDLRGEGKLLGYGYHFVHIPADYADSKLEIIMHITENDAFSNFTVPSICNSDVVIRDFIVKNRLPLVVDIFLIVFGVLVLAISSVFCLRDKRFFRLLCVGGFSLGIGCWSLCSYDLIILFTYNLQVKAYMEFLALYISPFFVLLYFWKDELITRNRVIEAGYKFLLGAQGCFIVVACVLQAANILHLPTLLKVEHILLACLSVGIVGLTVYDIAKKQLKKKVLLIGISIMLLIGVYDMIRFAVQKYLVSSGESHYSSILCVGAMVFVLSQLADFCMKIGEIFLQGAKAQFLEQMAYVDGLTGVANRRRCEEIWDSFDREATDYGIYSFDLNSLKKTNDTMGHAEGDELIKRFAGVLSLVFGQVGTVGRFGGDEFVVFIPDLENVNMQQLEQRMEEEIEKENEKSSGPKLSAAYGFCRHRDYPGLDSRQIYQIADQNMYQKKAEMKGAIRYGAGEVSCHDTSGHGSFFPK